MNWEDMEGKWSWPNPRYLPGGTEETSDWIVSHLAEV
jgi:hypothetical protein